MIDISKVTLNFSYDEPDIEEIRRCLVTLYTTKEGTQPLDRKFGLNTDFIGLPIPAAQNAFALEVIEKTERYESRVTVSSVTFKLDEINGIMYPVISLEKGEEDDE